MLIKGIESFDKSLSPRLTSLRLPLKNGRLGSKLQLLVGALLRVRGRAFGREHKRWPLNSHLLFLVLLPTNCATNCTNGSLLAILQDRLQRVLALALTLVTVLGVLPGEAPGLVIWFSGQDDC